jgi:hypothetical protein
VDDKNINEVLAHLLTIKEIVLFSDDFQHKYECEYLTLCWFIDMIERYNEGKPAYIKKPFAKPFGKGLFDIDFLDELNDKT